MILKAKSAHLCQERAPCTQPVLEALGAGAFEELSTAGPSELLERPKTGFFCSSKCPGSIVLKTFDVITRMRDEGYVIVSGFHSVMEWECLRILLRGRQPIIWVPARSIKGMRLKPELTPAYEAGRMLILSPFSPENERITKVLAERRNSFVASISDSLFVAHAVPRGRTESLVRAQLAHGKRIYTVDDPANAELLRLGAIPLERSEAILQSES